jgi:hypothetical protein
MGIEAERTSVEGGRKLDAEDRHWRGWAGDARF